MLELGQVMANDVICDLGSGDGRIVIAAAAASDRAGHFGMSIDLDASSIPPMTPRSRLAGWLDQSALRDVTQNVTRPI